MLRPFYTYLRLFLASWLFVGGLALLFLPTAASVARSQRWREGQLVAIPVEKRAQWIEDRDVEDARVDAYVRLFGVLLGGVGFSLALREAAHISYQRL